MKRLLFILGFAIGLFALPSCTKSIKDDIKTLEQQLEELKKKNDLLKGRAGTVEKVTGANEAISATTTYKTSRGTPGTYTETYPYKYAGHSTQVAQKQADGSYYVSIIRFALTQEDGAIVQFYYNHATKALSNQSVIHVWHEPGHSMYIRYNSGKEAEGCTPGVTLKSFDLSSGDISLDVSAAASAAFTQNGGFPYIGQPYTTQFSFTGKVVVINEVENP